MIAWFRAIHQVPIGADGRTAPSLFAALDLRLDGRLPICPHPKRFFSQSAVSFFLLIVGFRE
jgi:hypothetical protein